MSKQYRVILPEGERVVLARRVAAGKGSARDLTHARILLRADEGPGGPAWTDRATAAALEVSVSIVALG